MSFLGPVYLVKQIPLISLLMGAVILVIFSSFVNTRIVFPMADAIKKKSHEKIREIGTSQKIALYSSEALATLVFLTYCYLGASVLAEYIFAPIMYKSKNFLILILIAVFFTLSFALNNTNFRKSFF